MYFKIDIKFYNGCRDEQARVQKNKYYAKLWHEKNIFLIE
jgi:hypothetical protein